MTRPAPAASSTARKVARSEAARRRSYRLTSRAIQASGSSATKPARKRTNSQVKPNQSSWAHKAKERKAARAEASRSRKMSRRRRSPSRSRQPAGLDWVASMAVGSRAAKMYGKAQQKPHPAHQRHALHEREEEQDDAQSEPPGDGSAGQRPIQSNSGISPAPDRPDYRQHHKRPPERRGQDAHLERNLKDRALDVEGRLLRKEGPTSRPHQSHPHPARVVQQDLPCAGRVLHMVLLLRATSDGCHTAKHAGLPDDSEHHAEDDRVLERPSTEDGLPIAP